MKFQSMTGFGRGEAGDSEYAVTVEVKSVNHRFKEMRFKMPSAFSSIELDLKKALGQKFKRGSFDIYVNYKKTDKTSRFDELDQEKIRQFLSNMKKTVAKQGLNLTVNPVDFLTSEFYLERDDRDYEGLRNLVKQAFEEALVALQESRVCEGSKMRTVIISHRDGYDQLFKMVRAESPQFQKDIEAKLQKRFSEISQQLNIDENRYMQEVIYYLEKLDVSEEMNRIDSHLSKLDQLLEKSGEVGRQIDFLLQELNRETNTIGSKSNNTEISNYIVQMKVELEKIREQGLNIE